MKRIFILILILPLCLMVGCSGNASERSAADFIATLLGNNPNYSSKGVASIIAIRNDGDYAITRDSISTHCHFPANRKFLSADGSK